MRPVRRGLRGRRQRSARRRCRRAPSRQGRRRCPPSTRSRSSSATTYAASPPAAVFGTPPQAAPRRPSRPACPRLTSELLFFPWAYYIKRPSVFPRPHPCFRIRHVGEASASRGHATRREARRKRFRRASRRKRRVTLGQRTSCPLHWDNGRLARCGPVHQLDGHDAESFVAIECYARISRLSIKSIRPTKETPDSSV